MVTYDLEERTARFGEHVIELCRTIPATHLTRSIVDQLIRSSTSVGANYMEANGASSRKDFRNKIHICKKEVQETKHWLRMLASAAPDNKPDIQRVWTESEELTRIFGKITASLRVNK